jgi:superfamily I DNA/RNA helicase
MKNPSCPQCGSQMTLRNGKRGQFWGCSQYVKGCRGTRDYFADLPPIRPEDLPPGSIEQKSIWDFLANGTENALVEARAGSGKTYTITNGIYQLRGQKIAVFSFNTHIIKEMNYQLAKKQISWVRGISFNSFGFKTVKKAFPNAELFPDKVSSILIDLYSVDTGEADIIRKGAERLVDLCKAYLEDGKDQAVLSELIDRFSIEFGAEDCPPDIIERRILKAMELVPLALQQCIMRKDIIDFNDQVWFPVILNLPVERFDMVLIDEAQDTNTMQQRLVEMACP